jgi:hypothetical protein
MLFYCGCPRRAHRANAFSHDRSVWLIIFDIVQYSVFTHAESAEAAEVIRERDGAVW